jgi:hypothetical protein
MACRGEVLLLQRRCRADECGALFWICRSCDRGHGYCSEPCRRRQRREQLRRANRRHEQSPEGRLDHRDRQRTYRQRRARVTDQGRRSTALSGSIDRPDRIRAEEERHALRRRSIRCRVCGRAARWLDPFRHRV